VKAAVNESQNLKNDAELNSYFLFLEQKI